MQGENLQKEAGAHVSGIRKFLTWSFVENSLWMNCAEICKLAKNQKSTTWQLPHICMLHSGDPVKGKETFASWSHVDLKNDKTRGLFVFSKDYSNVQKADSTRCRTLPDSTQWRILANFYRLSEEVHFQIKRTTCSHKVTGFARGTPEIPDSRGDVLSHPPSYSLYCWEANTVHHVHCILQINK